MKTADAQIRSALSDYLQDRISDRMFRDMMLDIRRGEDHDELLAAVNKVTEDLAKVFIRPKIYIFVQESVTLSQFPVCHDQYEDNHVAIQEYRRPNTSPDALASMLRNVLQAAGIEAVLE